MSSAHQLGLELNKLSNPSDAQFLQRYFKAGKGQYGEGDVFIGVRVPAIRKTIARFKNLSLIEVEKLLESPVHEHRLAAVIIMTEQAKRSTARHKEALYSLYLKRTTDRINNWDIVDASCRDVVGRYLMYQPKEPLYQLAKSKNIWERRVAIVSTAYFIGFGKIDETFKIAEMLLSDKHDLIHKAVGWMLREAGKKDEAALMRFLDNHASYMPRTMLRYSLEKLHAKNRAHYMSLKSKTIAQRHNKRAPS